jgi:hypothetical protein
MRRKISTFVFLLLSTSLAAQSKRLWVLRASGEMVEYDSATFVPRQTVKVPAEAVDSSQSFAVNQRGQMLFAESVALPLSEGDFAAERKIWFWDGHAAASLTRNITRTVFTTGSNLAIDESVPTPFLSSEGMHLFWFQNQAHRLQRDGVDLSTRTAWSSWRTDLAGAKRQDVASGVLPECSCPTGGCEESCPYGEVWAPDDGVGTFFVLTEVVAGKVQHAYKSTTLYQENAGQWRATPIDPPLRRMLDAANPETMLEAIPDTGCCGWSNVSDDRTVLHLAGKTLTIFDELADYNNPDYDVSFYTENGKLSPSLDQVALTIAATAQPNTPIQLAEQGQANPEESQRIRKALLELPAVEVKSITPKNNQDAAHRVVFLPHATLVGWTSEREILIIEEHLLVLYNLSTAARRKSNIRVEDAAHVFLR